LLQATQERVGRRGNTSDMDSQPFYQFIEKTYALHMAAMFAALYAFGGLGAVVWGGALRCVWVYHITWFVNSASHVWGTQTYNTGDLSRNNWCVRLSVCHAADYGTSVARAALSVGALFPETPPPPFEKGGIGGGRGGVFSR
jgi:fatty-acid desaturase